MKAQEGKLRKQAVFVSIILFICLTILAFVITKAKTIYPEIVMICPDNRFIPLDKLGLGEQTILAKPESQSFNWDVNDVGIYKITSSHPIPERLSFLDKGGYENFWSIEPSPDGRWIMSLKRRVFDGKLFSWINSLEGTQEFILDKTGDYLGTNWLNENSILLIDKNLQKIPGTIPMSTLSTKFFTLSLVKNRFLLPYQKNSVIAILRTRSLIRKMA
jgi:hypothetical protein